MQHHYQCVLEPTTVWIEPCICCHKPPPSFLSFQLSALSTRFLFCRCSHRKICFYPPGIKSDTISLTKFTSYFPITPFYISIRVLCVSWGLFRHPISRRYKPMMGCRCERESDGGLWEGCAGSRAWLRCWKSCGQQGMIDRGGQRGGRRTGEKKCSRRFGRGVLCRNVSVFLW